MALKHSFFPSSTCCSLQANHYFYALHPLRIGRNPISLKPFSQSPSPSFSNSSIPGSTPSPLFLSFLEEDEVADEEEERLTLSETQQSNQPDNDPIRSFFLTRTADQESDPDPRCLGKLSLQENRKTSWHLAPITGSAEDDDDEVEDIPNSLLETLPPNPRIEGIVSQIVEKAKSLPENVTLGEVLGEFEGRVGREDCEEVLRLLGNEGLVIDCLYFFEWMGLNEPSLITPRAYTTLFPILGRAGMSKELLVLFKNMPNRKMFRDVYVYNAAISGLLYCRRYDDAWEVYQSMETNSVQPDHVTSSIMITIMRKQGGSAKEAWEFFEKMNKEGTKWSLEGAGALIKSFCDEGLKKEALIIQLEMEKRGISSNAIIYSTLMHAYCKSNQIEEAEGLFAEMKRKKISPTSATYNTLMDAYSRRLQPDVVEKLLQEMEDAGLEPNVKSYTCLISAYGRLKKMSDLAANAFLRMTKAGIKPNSYSYTALIHAYSVGGWHDKAYAAFENMQREGIKPSIETYTALLDAFRRSGDTETLMKIWKMMMREKVEGTRVTFNILVDGFAKQGCYVEARDVICEFGKLGLQPTVMTYNMLINGFTSTLSSSPSINGDFALKTVQTPNMFRLSVLIPSLTLLISVSILLILAPRILPPRQISISILDELDDLSLFHKAIAAETTFPKHPSHKLRLGSTTVRPPKIAFMFLTNSDLQFSPIWEKFFNGTKPVDPHLYNIYIHADPSIKISPLMGVFRDRFIPAKRTQRSSPTLISAARRLLAHALLDDPSNSYFALISQHCTPLHSFNYFYNFLFDTQKLSRKMEFPSYIEILDESDCLLDRYNARGKNLMEPEVKFEEFKVGSQFFVLTRKHSLMVIKDRKLWRKFRKPCINVESCYPEEHYFPTLLSMEDPNGCTKYTLTNVNWTDSVDGHPHTYHPSEVSSQLIYHLRESNSTYSYMFARKFSADCLNPLMEMADSVIFKD